MPGTCPFGIGGKFASGPDPVVLALTGLADRVGLACACSGAACAGAACVGAAAGVAGCAAAGCAGAAGAGVGAACS